MRQKKDRKKPIMPLLVIFFLFFLFFLFAENSSALPSNQVKKVIFEQNGNQEHAVIQLNHSPNFSWFSLKHPNRIAVDIKDAFLPEVTFRKAVPGKMIKAIRVSQNQKNCVRAVLDLNSSVPCEFQIKKGTMDLKPALYLTVLSIEDIPLDRSTGIELHRIAPIASITESSSPELLSIEQIPADDDKSQKSEIQMDDDLLENVFENENSSSSGRGLALSGTILARPVLQIKENEIVENNTEFKNQILVEAKYKDSLIVSAISDYLFFGPENETDNHDLEIHEAKLRYWNPRMGLSLGKQILRWGKTDQISPVDTLNPEDLREFILPDYEERKIPVWMADIRLFFDSFTLEGVIVPFFKNSRFDYFQTNWSVFGHLKQEFGDSPIPQSFKTYFSDLRIREQLPANETEWGLRLSQTIKNFDLGLTFHHTIEDTPYFKNFPIKNINLSGDFSTDTLISELDSAVLTDQFIEADYRRTNIAGFAFETTLSDFGIRGEAVWQENESFLTSSLTSVRNPVFTWILGADYTSENSTYLNLQFAHRHISQYDPAILYFDRDTVSILGEIRIDLVSDWLKACVKFTKNLTDNSLYLNPYLKYTRITNLECRAGAGLFSGDRDTWFGRYHDYDLFYIDIAYRF